MRYNTTNSWPEVYTNDGWKAFAAQPYISSVSPTVIAGNSGAVIDIYGTNFSVEAQVYFIDEYNNPYIANTVTYYSNTHISAPTPRDFTVGVEPLDVRVVQNSGIYTLQNAIDCGTVPTWVTTAGSLGSIFGANTVNVYVSATDAESSVTYSLTSGSLPGGLTFSSNGLVQGVATGVTATTTYNFTIKASDIVTNNVDRAFSYQILNRVPVFNTASSLSTITDSMLDGYSANVSINAYDPDGGVVTYAVTVGSVPTGFIFNTSNGALQMTNANTAEVTTNTTSTFTVSATDVGSGVETRQFNITVEHPKDQDFPNTVLLLSATDSNTVLKDASSNNLNLTVFGDSRATNFSPYNTSWSNSFDGSGDYLTTASYPGLNLNLNNNWTVEGWFYRTGSLGNQGTFATLGTGGSNVYWSFAVGGTNGVVSFGAGAGNWNFTSTADSSTGVIALNRWHHVAWVRNGATTLSMYVDGVQVYNNTSFNFGSATQGGTLHLGTYYANYNNDGSWYNGYISNFRIVNGTSIYTSAFTPPTSPLSNVANTVLLTSHTNRFVNESNTSTSFARNGDVKVVGWSPFAETDTTTGSIYLDGTGDYVQSLTSNNSLAFGTGDFTIEFWNYGTASGRQDWTDFYDGNIANRIQFLFEGTNIGYYNNNTLKVGGARTPTLYSWNHYALSRNSGVSRVFINGQQHGSSVSDTVNYTGQPVSIGQGNSGTASQGYFADFRILNGTGLYTANFAPPTIASTNIANTKLLTFQNRQPHNNHGFQDKSNNKSLITRNGNTTLGTFTPFNPGGFSSTFGSTNGNRLYCGGVTPISTGPFTMEFFVHPFSAGTIASTFTWNVGNNRGWDLNVGSSGELSMSGSRGIWNDSTGFITGNTSIVAVPFYKWSHIAVTRDNSNVLRLFVNGIIQGSITLSQSLDSIGGSNPGDYEGLRIGSGGPGDGTFYGSTWSGFIGDFRIVDQACLYTSNFTPSFTPLTLANTGIDRICVSHAPVLRDISANNYNIYYTNGQCAQVPFSPYTPNTIYDKANTGGSIFFDGTTDYLTLADSDLWDLPGDFTIDGWMYINAANAGGFVSIGRYDNPQNGIDIYISQTTGLLIFYSNGAAIITGQYIRPRTWYHIALVRSGTTVTMYVNGKRSGPTATSSVSYTGVSGFGVGIGVEFGGGANIGAVTAAYIANPRIIKGQALYTANTSIPTEPPRVTPNTVLLIDGTDAAIIDYTGKNVFETVGNARANNTVAKFGNGSITINSDVTSRLQLAHGSASPIFNMGTGDHTIEFWMNSGTPGGQQCIFDFRSSDTTGQGIAINYSTSRTVFVYMGATRITSSALTANVWNHIAVVRASNVYTLYLNGVSQGTWSNSDAVVPPTGRPYIGAVGDGSQIYTGALSDFRITRSARYTANFTPRPRKLPRR
jgi:hypothetical protein